MFNPWLQEEIQLLKQRLSEMQQSVKLTDDGRENMRLHQHIAQLQQQLTDVHNSDVRQPHCNNISSLFFSAICNIYISCLCYDVSVRLSVRLSVTEVHWCIISNLGFKFRSQFTAHCGRGACGGELGRDHCREEWRDHLALC